MDLQKEKILGATVWGFEFEFYSNKSRSEIAKEIGQLVRKKIKVGDKKNSEVPIGSGVWKIEPDFSGGIKMHELITEPMPYHEAMAVMFKIMGWIRQFGWTDEKCAFQANLSFDRYKIELKDRIENINRMKFVLGFDEKFIYEKFPKRKNSIYARSINSIFPINKFVFNDDVKYVFKENYELPGEKYYGINFSKLAKGYMEVRYMGGRGYEKMSHSAKEIIDYIGIFTYDVLQNNYDYTEQEISRLRNSMKEFKKVVTSFSDYDNFCLNYPNMRILVDLKGDREIMRTFYPQIREKIFELIVRCGVRRGVLNYDADIGKYQLKGAVISYAFPLKGIEVFDSKISSGNVIDCDLYRCEINNSHILDCNLYQGNRANKCKIINTPFHAYNESTDCYFDNKKAVINGKVEKGIIRSGEIGPLAKVSKETEVVEAALDSKDSKDLPTSQGGKDKEMPKTAPGFKPNILKI